MRLRNWLSTEKTDMLSSFKSDFVHVLSASGSDLIAGEIYDIVLIASMPSFTRVCCFVCESSRLLSGDLVRSGNLSLRFNALSSVFYRIVTDYTTQV